MVQLLSTSDYPGLSLAGQSEKIPVKTKGTYRNNREETEKELFISLKYHLYLHVFFSNITHNIRQL